MSTELPERKRAGKYCPRCHAMMPREQAVCSQCGHQFRTGADRPPAEAASTSDPMNRTMQFTLPPMPMRPAAAVALPPQASAALVPNVPSPRAGLALAAAALLFCVIAAFGWHVFHRITPTEASPAGVWETTLRGRAAANAQLDFVLRAGGTGVFSWRESGPASLAGQTPLHWSLNPGGKLILALNTPADGDPTAQTLTDIFSRHSWAWHLDSGHPRRLILGTLVFTEKP